MQRSEGMIRKLKIILVLLELAIIVYSLESAGIREGCFRYNYVYITIGNVPVMIIVGWLFLSCMAYLIAEKYNVLMGILTIFCVDLILEPIAYCTGLWTWLNPITPQIYFGASVINMILWLLYPLVAIQLLSWTEK